MLCVHMNKILCCLLLEMLKVTYLESIFSAYIEKLKDFQVSSSTFLKLYLTASKTRLGLYL